jgi:hypothetical protein
MDIQRKEMNDEEKASTLSDIDTEITALNDAIEALRQADAFKTSMRAFLGIGQEATNE